MNASDNPYAPPRVMASDVSHASEEAAPDLESVRLANFAAEGHVRAVGLLSYATAVSLAVAAVSMGIAVVLSPRGEPVTLLGALTVSWAISAALLFRGGFALRRVETKGRVFYVFGIMIGMLANWIVGALSGSERKGSDLWRTVITLAIAASLWDAKRTPLFTTHYQTEVLAKTRHLVAPTARWFWWLLGMVGLGVAGGILLAVFRD